MLKKLLKVYVLLISGVLFTTSDLPSLVGYVLGAISQSNIMHSYSTNIQKKIDKATTHAILKYDDEPASEEYQKLGKEAQCAVGIPQHRQVPIKKINPESPIASLVAAIAEADAIYVNEDKLNQMSYGAKRSGLFHEAVHVKYHDKAMDSLCELGGCFTAAIGTYAGLKYLKIASWNKSISFLIGVGIASYMSSKYHHFMEQRADIEGHLATKCADCVLEHAQRRKKLFELDNHALKDSGYLWASDLEKIAQELGDQKCAYHSDNKI